VRLLHARLRGRDRRPAGAQPEPDDDEIREALSGNLCRCTGYAKIFDAVRLAAGS
jgi:carbon-monoxide dehydrogenase small subunit